MPYAAWVATNGLNACVIVLSGELSITRVGVAAAFPLLEFELGVDEHAARPRHTLATAARLTRPRRLSSLLILSPDFVEGR